MEALIYETITKVMQDISAISKGRKNQQQGFAYRGIDDVMNELHPVMAQNGLFVVPEVLHEERMAGQTKNGGAMNYTRLTIKFTFYAKDGSNVAATVIGEAMDSGDKASNKALSIGLKYALLQVFCIPTEDDKDPDAESHEMATPAPQVRQAPKPALQLAGGDDTAEEKDKINELLSMKGPDGKPIFPAGTGSKLSEMRRTKTAKQVIDWLNSEVTKATTAAMPEGIF